jgi:hypothetical protein
MEKGSETSPWARAAREPGLIAERMEEVLTDAKEKEKKNLGAGHVTGPQALKRARPL